MLSPPASEGVPHMHAGRLRGSERPPLKYGFRVVDTWDMGLSFLSGYVLGQHATQSARLAVLSGNSSGPSLDDLLDVHDRVDRVVLVIEAMWSLLEEGGYTAEQLKERIEAIDAADGTQDGKRTARIAQCRACGSKVAAGLLACQFCGTRVAGEPPDPLQSI